MIKLSKYSSYIRLLSRICVIIFVIGITLLMSISFFVPTTNTVYKTYLIIIYSSFGFLLFIEIIVRIIFIIDKGKIEFTQNSLKIGKKEYLYKELKLVYYGINMESILCIAPGKFIAECKKEIIDLGYYLPIEIRNIKKIVNDIHIY